MTFYETLEGGVLSFGWDDFLDDNAYAETRFLSPPKFVSIGKQEWAVALEFEIIP